MRTDEGRASRKHQVQPVFAFVNSKSGGQLGESLLQELEKELGRKEYVCDLSVTNPETFI